jgi:N-formylglutamate amidohydrolase
MYFEVSENNNSPIICNVPHSGTVIPEEFNGDFVLTQKDLEEEVLYMADNHTNTLYGELLSISSCIVSKISRVVVDIERFQNEEDEPMSKVGMSALYTRTSSGDVLRNISIDNKVVLEKIYKEYHDSFTQLVSSSLLKNNKAIIIDCHSFPSVPRVYEPEQDMNRPDICIGTDDFHTPKELVEILKHTFEKLGYSVNINTPFSGSIVPLNYYKKDERVISVMIEVNRKLYMNEETYQKNNNFTQVSKDVSRSVITSLNQFVR